MNVPPPFQRLAVWLWRCGHRLGLTGRPLAASACHKLAREVWLLGFRLRHGREMTALVRRKLLA